MFEQKLYDMIIIPVINGIRDEFHYEHHLDGPNKDESKKQLLRWLRRGASRRELRLVTTDIQI